MKTTKGRIIISGILFERPQADIIKIKSERVANYSLNLAVTGQ